MVDARLVRSVLALVSILAASGLPAAEEGDWIAESNRHALYVMETSAGLLPEQAAAQGLEAFDEEVMVLDENLLEDSKALLQEQIGELEKRLGKSEDPRVIQDLQILLDSRRQLLSFLEAEEELLVPYYNAAEIVFYGLGALLEPQVEAARRPAALVRLRRYAGLENGYRPITELAKERTEERAAEAGLVWPYRGEVQESLQNSPRFVAGLEQLFAASGLEGYEEDLAVLKEQLQVYDDWVRHVVLPRAREDFRQPGELYGLALEDWGVDATPDELIDLGIAGYMEIRNQMSALAPRVAEFRGWDLTDYRDVIAELKKEQFEGEAIVERYTEVNQALEEIIVEQGIVSLPERPAIIRVATDAEAARQPQPHLNVPRLINNTGELVEFLIPVPEAPGEGVPGSSSDNTFEAMAWTLAAHELRPGHELQFSAILDRGVSTARALFAFNSTNVEGWALYAEAEVMPYLPLDGQLSGLQMRLLRAARCFLDPMLNTGRITREEARRVLIEEVVMTPATADLELARYTFSMPGQAPAYYYGYRRLLEIRGKAEVALGDRFDRRSYHDFVLDQGLLPPDLLERAVVTEYIPSRSAVAGG